MLAGCGSDEPASAPQRLGPEAQQARNERCGAVLQEYRDKGVWIAGGAKPVVDAKKFNALSNAEQQKLADTAACISTAGQTGPAIDVEFVEPGISNPVATIRGENSG